MITRLREFLVEWGKMEEKEEEKAVWLVISKQILSNQNCFFCFYFFSTQNLHSGGL